MRPRILLACLVLEDVGERVESIVAADGSDEASSQFPSAVYLPGSGSSCTGTLIAPGWVLTAAHCVERGAPDTVYFAGQIGGASDTPASRIPVARCHMSPDYLRAMWRFHSPFYDGVDPTTLGDRCGVLTAPGGRDPVIGEGIDVALLELARPVPRAAAQATATGAGVVFVDSTALFSGLGAAVGPFVSVGFGNTSPPPVSSADGGRRRFRLSVPAVSSSASATWTIARSVLGGGDSGGPLFHQDASGRLSVVGVAGDAASDESNWHDVSAAHAPFPTMRSWLDATMDPDGDGHASVFCPGSAERSSDTSIPNADDLDGDYVLDAVDSCPEAYNPCQLGRDSDGDGVDDDCDACPFDADVSGATGTVGPDFDLDGLPDTCDCAPTFFTPWIDSDGDSRRDLICDNCPLAPNGDQADCNDNGQGDACEDADEDGILDVCGENDNCPTPNPAVGDTQPDCNIDAELAALESCLAAGSPETCPRSAYVRGDACDPTPCGDTLFAGARTLTGGRVALDQVRVDAIADVDTPVLARTGLRFCRCPAISGRDTPEERDACIAEVDLGGGTTAGGCDPAAVPVRYDAPLEPPSWRWTTVGYTRVAAAPGSLPSGLNAEAQTDHGRRADGVFNEDLVARWRFEDRDVPRWASWGETIATGPGAFLPGILLTHEPGGPTGPATTWDRALSSHLESGVLRYEAPLPPAPARDCAPAFPASFSGAMCPFCAASLPRPWMMGWCGGSFRGLIDVAGTRIDPTILGAPPLPDPPIDGEWLAPSEPLPSLRQDSIRLVGMAPGFVVQQAFVEVGNQLVDLLSPCSVPGQCGPAPQLARASSSVGLADHDGARVVLSGTRGEVYVVGGFDPAGTPRNDVWAFDIRTESWRELVSPAEIGTVLAASFDATRGELIVLGEVSRRVRFRTVREARILAIPVDARGVPRLLASFIRLTTNDRFSLAVDVVGNIWVAARLPVGRAHVLVQLQRSGDALRVGSFRAGAGRLAPGDALRVDPLGPTVLIEDPRLGVTEVGVSHRDLIRLPGATDRCF